MSDAGEPDDIAFILYHTFGLQKVELFFCCFCFYFLKRKRVTMEDDMDLSEEDMDLEDYDDSGLKRPRKMLSGRGVTLNMLINDGILEAGDGHLTIDYLGNKFVGDLLPEGTIRWQETKEVFSSPSAWAIHCKKLLNPDRKPGCGWSSIKYKGKKLDVYKMTWFRKFKAQAAAVGGQILPGFLTELEIHSNRKSEGPPILSHTKSGERVIVNHNILGSRSTEHDQNTLVLSTPFSALDRIQPFTVTIATNCLLLIDFHCHLCKSEVTGYLGGTWDIASHNLAILQAFPCKTALGDSLKSTRIEQDIRQSLERRNLTLVGWYHSHTTCQPQPTLRDIDNQMEYQIIMKGDCDSSYTPCLGLICSPSSSEKHLEADHLVYWVMPPPENQPNEYGRPMHMTYNVAQDSFLTQDLLMEMRQLAEYYRGAIDCVDFRAEYKGFDKTVSMWEKLKISLTQMLPRDLQVTGGQPAAHVQAVNHFWEFLKGLILT